MEETLFYVCGGALVLAALAVSAVGLRSESFPPSRGAMVGGLAVFAALVAATTTFGVWNARTEQDHRRAELAEAGTEEPAPPSTEPPPAEGEKPPAAAATTLELAVPAGTDLAYETDQLDAKAGTVTIELTNPQSVAHDVVVESDGSELARSDLIADDATSEASTELNAGEYVYFCSVPGHREAGMEGALTVN